MDSDKEMLKWVRDKIHATTNLKAETNRELYGAMHVLCSDRGQMDRYIRAYKCNEKQGVIANLSDALQRAIEQLEASGQDAGEFRAAMKKADEVLGVSSGA